MGRADLHVHTTAGDGLDDVTGIFDWVERHATLDVLAITEHDDLSIALRAREEWARSGRRFDFVPGVEVTTLEGHLLALFVDRQIPSFQRVEETIDRVHDQGGLCVVPHPLNWLTRSMGPATLARCSTGNGRGPSFDAIELATTSPASRCFLPRARAENIRRYHLPGVGASDAHFASAVGTAWTEFPGCTAGELKGAIMEGRVSGVAGKFPSLRSVGFVRAAALPFTGLRATPRKMGWRCTVWSFISRYRLPSVAGAAKYSRAPNRPKPPGGRAFSPAPDDWPAL
jgi:predicted metal-dependent phosphoesterase TrpH